MNETYKIPGTNIVLSFKDNGDGTHTLAGIAKLLGQNGGTIISDTNPHSVDCYAIQAITDVVVSAMTLKPEFSGSMSGVTIKAGTNIMIAFTSITLTSGTAIVYKN